MNRNALPREEEHAVECKLLVGAVSARVVSQPDTNLRLSWWGIQGNGDGIFASCWRRYASRACHKCELFGLGHLIIGIMLLVTGGRNPID